MYIRNESWSKIDPGGIPQVMPLEDEAMPSITTICFRSQNLREKEECIHLIQLLSRPTAFNLHIKILWFTVSNAVL